MPESGWGARDCGATGVTETVFALIDTGFLPARYQLRDRFPK
jgi:hypothetical protein